MRANLEVNAENDCRKSCKTELKDSLPSIQDSKGSFPATLFLLDLDAAQFESEWLEGKELARSAPDLRSNGPPEAQPPPRLLQK